MAMKYVYENFVNKDEVENAKNRGFTINVRFCRDCPLFEIYSFQPERYFQYGWCRRMSYYDTFDNECPHYVDVNSNSFCNEDDIKKEDY